MATFNIPDDLTLELESWAEFFGHPVEETLLTILKTALEDLRLGSPMFFDALDPPEEGPLPYFPEKEDGSA
jgi:hypothetical protein